MGYLSGWFVVDEDYKKTIRPFEWGMLQILSVAGLFICWILNIRITWLANYESDGKTGAIAIASLPVVFALFFLTGLLSLEPK